MEEKDEDSTKPSRKNPKNGKLRCGLNAGNRLAMEIWRENREN